MRKIPRPTGDLHSLYRHGGVVPPAEVLDFSASINPLGPPRTVLRRLFHHLVGEAPPPSLVHYPDPACTNLALRLAGLHGVDPGQVVVGNGSTELIHALPRALACRRVAV